jgi:hypothetical protein
MDEYKKRILSSLETGNVRLSAHFLKRCQDRGGNYFDAERVLRNGALDLKRCEGENLAFVGTDTKDRKSLVIVRIDDNESGRLVLVSFRPLDKGER